MPFVATPSIRAVCLALAVAGVVVSASARVAHPSFRRPIQPDELLSLQNYTWAGVNSDGSRRVMGQQADVDSIDRPDLRRLAVGFYCALGRWPEPNNHVPHSLLMNAALLLPVDTLTAIRLPALLCGSLFAIGCGVLCAGHRVAIAAPIVALLAMWHPYCVHYFQESRGYALMLLLCLAWAWLLTRLPERKSSLVLTTTFVVVACLTFMNLVNLSVDWVLPVLFAALFAPRAMTGQEIAPNEQVDWRRAIVGMALVISGIGLLFLIDRLPYVYSSVRQYGVPVNRLANLTDYLSETRHAFAPGMAWGAVMSIGAAGALLAAIDARSRWRIAAWGVAVVASLAHWALARKLPYVRNLGYLLPPLFLGFGIAIEKAIQRQWPRPLKGVVVAAMVLVLGLATARETRVDLTDHEYAALFKRLQAIDAERPTRRTVLLGHGVAPPILLSLSHAGDPLSRKPGASKETETELMLIEKKRYPFSWTTDDPRSQRRFGENWLNGIDFESGAYRVRRWSFVEHDAAEVEGIPFGVAVWLPPFELVALNDDRALAALKELNLPFTLLHERYQAKLEVFSRLKCALIHLDRTTPPLLRSKLMTLADRLGGRIRFMTPTAGRGETRDPEPQTAETSSSR